MDKYTSFFTTLDLCQPFLVFLHTSRQKRHGYTIKRAVNAVVNSRFPEMSIEGRRQIESILIREEFPKGAIALNEGEVAHELVFVGKGMLRQYYYKNGKDVTEHFSYEGCIVMCIESFSETSTYPANRGNSGTFHYLLIPPRHDTKISEGKTGKSTCSYQKDIGILFNCITG